MPRQAHPRDTSGSRLNAGPWSATLGAEDRKLVRRIEEVLLEEPWNDARRAVVRSLLRDVSGDGWPEVAAWLRSIQGRF